MEQQLTLFGAFDKEKKKQEKLFKELKAILRNFQFLQGHINAYLSDTDPASKDRRVYIMNSCRQSIDFANYYLTCLMFAVTRGLDEHKEKVVGHYNDMGKFDPYKIPTDRLTTAKQYKCINENKSLLERLIYPYKDEIETNNTTKNSYKFLMGTVENIKTNLELLKLIDEKS